MKAVIDSDVLIDYLQGVEAARVELEQYDQLLYSVDTLLAGVSLIFNGVTASNLIQIL